PQHSRGLGESVHCPQVACHREPLSGGGEVRAPRSAPRPRRSRTRPANDRGLRSGGSRRGDDPGRTALPRQAEQKLGRGRPASRRNHRPGMGGQRHQGGLRAMSEKLNLPLRPRRNRKSEAVRGLARETWLHPEDLIYPLFLHEDPTDHPIASMPGCTRWSLEGLVREVGAAWETGIRAVVLFPKIEEALKSPRGEECANPEGLVPRAIRALKAAYPGLAVITDVALDPYNSDGHDGIVTPGRDGELRILNDETVAVLCRQALCHAEAG